MSTSAATAKPGLRRGPVAILAGLVVLALAALLLGRSTPLERSPIGFDGLGRWLSVNDIATRQIRPGAEDTFRVLGVFDGDLADGSYTDGSESSLGALAPRGLSRWSFEARIEEAETLVVLPKWRGGVVAHDRVHPDFLIPELYLWFLESESSVLRPDIPPFRRLPVRSAESEAVVGEATLYAPQVLSAAISVSCEPVWLLGDQGVLLARCDDYQDLDPFYVLSDPDLLNNHGLSLGKNAELALVLARELAEGRPVLVDQGGMAWDDGAEPVEGADTRERSGSDLERLFRYPFSLVWLSVAFASALALWRGNVRFGPALSGAEGMQLRSKEDAIRASGGLMRRAGGEGDLALAHGRARMSFLGAALLGPANAARKDGSDEVPLMRFLAARAPALGIRLRDAWSNLSADGLSPAARIDALPPFEAAFQEILDEFGRAARPPRRDRD